MASNRQTSDRAVFTLATAVVLFDQITKYWVWKFFILGEVRPVIRGLFNLRYVRNEGAAFGMFAGHRWPLIVISLVMLWVLRKSRNEALRHGRTGFLALALLTGGIVGNLLDRVRLGYVVDFMDFFLYQHHFPAFNVADAAICLGVAFYFWCVLRDNRSTAADAPGDDATTPTPDSLPQASDPGETP